MTALLVAVLFVGLITIGIDSLISGAVGAGLITLGVAAVGGITSWMDFREAFFYRLVRERDWLEMRLAPGFVRRIEISNIHRFVEEPSVGGILVSEALRFRFSDESGKSVWITTRIPGWAAVVESCHQEIPWIVPPARSLLARTVPKHRELAHRADIVPEPGQDIPEEKSWVRRLTKRDIVFGYGLAALIVFPIHFGVVVWLISSFDVDSIAIQRAGSYIAGGIWGLSGPWFAKRIRRRRIDRTVGWEARRGPIEVEFFERDPPRMEPGERGHDRMDPNDDS